MNFPRIRKHYYLGMAMNHAGGEWLRYLFTIGTKKDCTALKRFLSKKYNGKAILCKNGRSALAIVLKTYFKPGDSIIVNGFTCYAVYEAVRSAGLNPVFADIDKKTLNYNLESLNELEDNNIRGIIVQNTLGNPVDIKAIEDFAHKRDLIIIEDLAHCAGLRYRDKREAGTVGRACILSFGKDKAIDTVSGGAAILRNPPEGIDMIPNKSPRLSDHLRARLYPMFGAMSRNLTYLGLGGALMRALVGLHLVEKSADNKLDTKRRLSKFEAKLALKQLQELRRDGEPPVRQFYYVHDRARLLRLLQKNGYYFGGFWYEKPVSPSRYYGKTNFPESRCPNAVYAAEHIINIPNYYTHRDLSLAHKIIKNYLEKGDNEQ